MKEHHLNLRAIGRRGLDLLGQAAFNEHNGAYRVSGVPIRYDDTVATYELKIEAKSGRISKPEMERLRAWAMGFLVGLRYAGIANWERTPVDY